MSPDSALGLQEEIFSRLFGFVALPTAQSTHGPRPDLLVDPWLLETKSGDPGKRARPVADIALGIAAGGSGGVRLAVLVQSRGRRLSLLADRIVAAARGEAEIRHIGRQRPLWTTARNDPLRLGCSVSPAPVAYAGTLGSFCRDAVSGRAGILSNNHVLADVNRLPPGTRIMQPGARDGGRPGTDDIGELLRFVPIRFGGLPNWVDAAVAALIDHGRGEVRHTLFGGDEPPAPALEVLPETLAEAAPGMTVLKTGRTTGHQRGRVVAVNVNNYLVDMGVGIARFDGQLAIEAAAPPQPFGRPGDSGALVVDPTGAPVGLLAAGSASGGAGNVGIVSANPISSVISELGVTLI